MQYFLTVFFLVFAHLAWVSSLRITTPSRYFSRLRSTWQEDLDRLLQLRTSLKERTLLTKDIIFKVGDITSDVVSAVQEHNLEKIAPRSLGYGRAIQGIHAFQNQIISDLIPDLFTKAVPRLVGEGPKLINQIIEKAPAEIKETGQKAIASAREMVQQPGILHSTLDELRRELRNVFLTNPEGLEEPYFEVLYNSREYQVRRNTPYSLCSTSLSSTLLDGDDSATSDRLADNAESFDLASDPLVSSAAYLRLVRYFFGENTRENGDNVNGDSFGGQSFPVLFGNGERLPMTTPVIVDGATMSCVLPQQLDSATAPLPTSEMLTIVDVPREIVAVRDFSGLITEGEIKRQKAKLEHALLAQNIDYDPATFKVLQYNPPYTLPWMRRNEISVKLTSWVPPRDASAANEDSSD